MARVADTPRAALLAVAAALSGLLMVGAPFVALPIAALALAYLWSSGHRWLALGAIAVAAALMGALDVPSGLLAAVTLVSAGPLAVAALRRRSPLQVSAALTVVVFAATVAAQAMAAKLAGSTIGAEVAQSAAETIKLLGNSLGESVQSTQLRELQRLLVETWAATNLQVCAVAALLAVGAAGLGTRLAGQPVRSFPRLAAIDLGLQVVLLPVAAIVALAAGRLSGNGPLEVVALNALLVSRVPLALQGIGVFAATYDRVGLRRGARSIGYALTVFVELTTYAVSLVGLVDFWANFRRLPRDGEPKAPSPLEEPGSSG